MFDKRKRLGAKGEKIAARFLRGKKFKIRQMNYTCKLGEIDIIAEQNGIIVFVEVKTRRSTKFGPPESAINYAKRNRISRVALHYIKEKNLIGHLCRFDAVAITFPPERKGRPAIKHIVNAFQLDRRYTY